MSKGAVAASVAERRAEREREKREHEAKLQRQILDWIEVVRPARGDILVLRVPNEKFVHPGTAPEDITDEQRSTMESCHQVLGVLLQNIQQCGILPGGAAIIAESMKLEDLPPPWERHPDAREETIQTVRSRILLPPGTKI
jgi:hypothetical protein